MVKLRLRLHGKHQTTSSFWFNGKHSIATVTLNVLVEGDTGGGGADMCRDFTGQIVASPSEKTGAGGAWQMLLECGGLGPSVVTHGK